MSMLSAASEVLVAWPLRDSGESVYARAFGNTRGDLDVDFAAPPPVAVTRLLLACLRSPQGRPFPENEIWQWPLGRRLQGLLAVACATLGAEHWLELRCTHDDCRHMMDLEIDLRRFQAAPPARQIRCEPAPGHVADLRVPTGEDELRWWAEKGTADEDALAASLVVAVDGAAPAPDWQLPDGWLEPLGDALQQQDPLTAPALVADCPECRREVEFELDLEDTLLRLLRTEQSGLLDQIHRLAMAYHWGEAEIVSLPPPRRQYYLDRIDREVGA